MSCDGYLFHMQTAGYLLRAKKVLKMYSSYNFLLNWMLHVKMHINRYKLMHQNTKQIMKSKVFEF